MVRKVEILRGKPFWHAERQGGPLWMQPQVLGRDKKDGRVAEPEDIRVWSMSSFAAGARGMLNLRYRPLLDGPLFGAFGSYGMDGARTPRSDMASQLAKWTNAPEQTVAMAAKPVKGDIGILVVPEVQQWDYLLSHEGGFDTYSAAMWGAYQGFFDNNIQADWVHIDDIEDYDTLYFPYPIMLPEKTARQISDWVAAGGKLIAEACPGYFGDRGKVGTVQPHNGLDELFGVREDQVEFMPDIGDRIRFSLDGMELLGGGFLQSYKAASGTERGWFNDGRLAVVENDFGKGQTRLVGTHTSVAYYRKASEAGRKYFADCLNWAGKKQHVACSNAQLQVRLHVDPNGQKFVWAINPTLQQQSGRLTFGSNAGGAELGDVLWGDATNIRSASEFSVHPRDALVVALT